MFYVKVKKCRIYTHILSFRSHRDCLGCIPDDPNAVGRGGSPRQWQMGCHWKLNARG